LGGMTIARLIDADALAMHFNDWALTIAPTGNETVSESTRRMLQWDAIQEAINSVATAPTIDAIPVEWLRERKHWAAIDGDHWAENIISYLLEAWQKEQEAKQ